MGLPMMPPTDTTPSCCVSRLKPSMAAVVFVDWSSATTRLSRRPCPRPFTPPDLLISFTASAIPARTWRPHGAKGPVSGVSTPSLIGLPWAVPLDPPYAPDPLNAAVSTTTAPTAVTNLYRFTSPSFCHACPRPGWPRRDVLVPTNRSVHYPTRPPCPVDISDRRDSRRCANRGTIPAAREEHRGHRRMYTALAVRRLAPASSCRRPPMLHTSAPWRSRVRHASWADQMPRHTR